jgi:carboxypeptidase T
MIKYICIFALLVVAVVSNTISQPEQKRSLLIQINNIAIAKATQEPVLRNAYANDYITSYLNNQITLLSTPVEFNKLKAKGYDIKILLEDTNKINLFKRAIYGETFKLSPVYHTYERIIEEIDALVKKHPKLINKFTIGKTTQEKRNIFAVKISNNTDKIQDKPGILFNGCQHANELLGAEICMKTINYLLENYNKDPQVTDWVNRYEIFVIPVVNVDGHYIVTHNINPNWRKNTRDLNNNKMLDDSDGVDVNRNYDFNWSHGGSGYQSSDRYRGEYPFSEYENIAFKNLADIKHFVFSLTFHSEGEVIYYPWVWLGRKAPDDSLLTNIANGLAGSIKTIKGDTCYKAEYGAGLVGQTYPWFYGRYGTFDFVIETSKGIQIPPSNMIEDIVNSNLNGIKYILDRAKGPGLTGHITDEKTGKPLQAVVWFHQIENEDVNRRKSDPEFGRFWRPLFPRSYNITIMKDGYETQVLKDLIVNKGEWTNLEIKLRKK